MIPHACDALLPKAERYASHKFRRLSRRLHPGRMDWGDAVELVAWVKFLGSPKAAQEIMRWSPNTVKQVLTLIRDPRLAEDAEPFLRANLAAVQPEDGFRILAVAREEGSRKGHFSKWVKLALQDEAHRLGLSAREQAEKHGLREVQVKWARRTKGRKRADRSLVGLAFG